jgi:hypothetical protein
MQQRIAAVFFLLVFLYNSVGYIAVFRLEQHRVRKEVKALLKSRIPESSLTVIRFSPSALEELEWIEPHEFRYKGQMYDVVRRSTEASGILVFHCINDKQEERLFANLDAHIALHLEHGKEEKNNKKEAFKTGKEYFLQHTYLGFPQYCEAATFPSFRLYAVNGTRKVPVPPPDKKGFLYS